MELGGFVGVLRFIIFFLMVICVVWVISGLVIDVSVNICVVLLWVVSIFVGLIIVVVVVGIG